MTEHVAPAAPPNVIYIAGAGRSGSTILDRVLGAIEGVASFNEMHVILTPDYMDRQVCSCGAERDDCDFWKAVLGKVGERHDIASMTKLSHEFDRSGVFFQLLTGLMAPSRKARLKRYGAFVRDLYIAIAAEAGVDTIVDSSKIPTRALLLRKYAGLPVRTLHLVRDMRGVAASWLRKKKDPSLTNGAMTRYSLSRTLLVWAFRQGSAELLRVHTPYRRIRYEDFAASPRDCVETIVDFAPHLKGRASGFISEFEVDLPPLHSLSGNPDRFEHGPTSIRIDDKWKKKAAGPALGAHWLFIFPFAARYGYLRKA